MSTRSHIGIHRKDNSVSSSYCHFDGYLEGVGAVLVNHYKTPEAVEELIKLGALRSIYPPPKGPTAYCKHLGEDYWSPDSWETLEEAQWDPDIEFIYLFDENTNTWNYKTHNNDEFEPVPNI